MAVQEKDGRYFVRVDNDTYSRTQAILAENGCKLKVHVVHGDGATLLRVWKYGTKADVSLLPSASGNHTVVFTPVGLFSKKASRQLCQELSTLLDGRAGSPI